MNKKIENLLKNKTIFYFNNSVLSLKILEKEQNIYVNCFFLIPENTSRCDFFGNFNNNTLFQEKFYISIIILYFAASRRRFIMIEEITGKKEKPDEMNFWFSLQTF